MTPAEADWVYEHVLTRRYKESTGCIQWVGARENRRDAGPGAAMLRDCECHYGPCGRCSDGRPDLCAHRRGLLRDHGGPDTYVVMPDGAALTGVWRVGRACRWHCTGPDMRSTFQPELFAVGAR